MHIRNTPKPLRTHLWHRAEADLTYESDYINYTYVGEATPKCRNYQELKRKRKKTPSESWLGKHKIYLHYTHVVHNLKKANMA